VAGNSNSGNRTGKRGKPLPVRVRLTESNARRLQKIPTLHGDIHLTVNHILKLWMDDHYPELPQS